MWADSTIQSRDHIIFAKIHSLPAKGLLVKTNKIYLEVTCSDLPSYEQDLVPKDRSRGQETQVTVTPGDIVSFTYKHYKLRDEAQL